MSEENFNRLVSSELQGNSYLHSETVYSIRWAQNEIWSLREEVERLQTIIDEANAQEPFDFYEVAEEIESRNLDLPTYFGGASSIGSYELYELLSKLKLYARPIPVQQSPVVVAPYTIGFSQALKICEIGFKCWSEKPHNKKWFKRIDGTPIPNDLICCIAEAFSDSDNSDDNLMELHALSRFEESCTKNVGGCKMRFLHKSTNVAGFYRNSDSARDEAIAIKDDAARGPTRPAVSARELKKLNAKNGGE